MDEETIRREQDIQRLRALLLEGAASPLEGPADDAYFERLHERIRKRARKRE
jgi:antitoxin ParD1/3/4